MLRAFLLPVLLISFGVTTTLFVPSAALAEDHTARFKELLGSGTLTNAKSEFSKLVEADATDHQARAALGILLFMEALEHLAQENYKFGLLQPVRAMFPPMAFPATMNPDPQEVSYSDLRKMIETLRSDLDAAAGMLAQVKTSEDLKLPFYIGQAMIDIDGDGMVSEETALVKLFSQVNGNSELPSGSTDFYVGVDGADVHWLRGYCHFLMANCDMILAYDQQDLFERCGHIFYPKTVTSYKFLRHEDSGQWMSSLRIADFIACVHLIDFPLIDAPRMRSAHGHLLMMMQQSRDSWALALAETDNDHEWIPNPSQTSVIPVAVSQEQINAWAGVIDEVEAVLEGKKLIPFWRDYFDGPFRRPADFPTEGRGVNVKKFFEQPQDFDLILLMTGSDAAPYLEEGALTTPESWARLTRVFQGQFFGFAVWFN